MWGSILDSVDLCRIFPGTILPQPWDNTNFLNLKNCLFYLSSIISQFLDLPVFHWKIFDFIFYHMTMKTLYKDRPEASYALGWLTCHTTSMVFMKTSFLLFTYWAIMNRGCTCSSDNLTNIFYIRCIKPYLFLLYMPLV